MNICERCERPFAGRGSWWHRTAKSEPEAKQILCGNCEEIANTPAPVAWTTADTMSELLQVAGFNPWSHYEREYHIPFPGRRIRADFAFPKDRLVVEVDGTEHTYSGNRLADAARDSSLWARGWRVLRFTPAQIHKDPSGVLATIRQVLTKCRSVG